MGTSNRESCPQPRQAGAERGRDRHFEHLVLGVTAREQRGHIALSHRVRAAPDLADIVPRLLGRIAVGNLAPQRGVERAPVVEDSLDQQLQLLGTS